MLKSKPKLKFDKKLLLFQWLLKLMEADSFERLAEHLKDPILEEVDEEGVSKFYHALTLHTVERTELTNDILLGYDENIVRHWRAITEKRNASGTRLHLKYFQYLSLLFAEIYLDRYFQNTEKLTADLNHHLWEFNGKQGKDDQLAPYGADDLNKVAFWMATGSGKTLLMHVNILQYRHYRKLHGHKGDIKTLLLTPNEGLSKQHLNEFAASGIYAEYFVKESAGYSTSLLPGTVGHAVEIIDIHKLAEQDGDKTVAAGNFEGKNLVLVDEGHRGASGEDWMKRRDMLCENGFSFEYSATFGQAMAATTKKHLTQKYAKCILFDYSYKYFYGDGYGKDYCIYNLADDWNESMRRRYLTACLLSFYQQQKLFGEKKSTFAAYLLEKPLWIFVGGSVNAVRKRNGRDVSDVLEILLFLAKFVTEDKRSREDLRLLLNGNSGLIDGQGRNLFANAFICLGMPEMKSEDLFDDILKVLFNATTKAKLRVENLRGVEGELALRLGENEPFGVINVGDTSKLVKLCDEQGELETSERQFSGSLFRDINETNSQVNILIGSKKFSEGWSSWRVSTMGLMNIGKSEGSEIIQLFGRGVRLKGKSFSLKRSGMLGNAAPTFIELLETLQVFGVRADYMDQFKQYLEEEGLPPNTGYWQTTLPVIKNLPQRKLKTLRLKDGIDFKKDGNKPRLELLNELTLRPVVLDWYPKIQASSSKGASLAASFVVPNEEKLREAQLAFLDRNAIYFELQQFKNEKSWYNLELSRDDICALLQDETWYELYIPKSEMEFSSFEKVLLWQQIAVALLKKYCDRLYKYRKAEYEAPFMEYRVLTQNDDNFLDDYQVRVQDSETALIQQIEALKKELEAGKLTQFEFGGAEVLLFDRLLYQPLIHVSGSVVKISPVALNAGEKDFVCDLRDYYQQHKSTFADKELYLLRNQSRGRGVGFFEKGGFYPDFILWILANDKQYITFLDPKGLRNLRGLDDPKIHFAKSVKELESRLNDSDIILNSFIVSPTSSQDVLWWDEKRGKEAFEEHHVLFQKDDHANSLLSKII